MADDDAHRALARAVRAVCLSNAPAKMFRDILSSPEHAGRRTVDTASSHFQRHIGALSGAEAIFTAVGFRPSSSSPSPPPPSSSSFSSPASSSSTAPGPEGKEAEAAEAEPGAEGPVGAVAPTAAPSTVLYLPLEPDPMERLTVAAGMLEDAIKGRIPQPDRRPSASSRSSPSSSFSSSSSAAPPPSPSPPSSPQPGERPSLAVAEGKDGREGGSVLSPATASLLSAAPPADLVRQLVEFGFPEQRAVEALGMFDNDVERAVNYLLSQPQPLPSSPSSAGGAATTGGGGRGREGGEEQKRTAEGHGSFETVPRPQSEDIEAVLARLDAEEAAKREEERRKAEEESRQMIEQLQKEEAERKARLHAREEGDKESVRTMLRQEMKAGRQLTQQQINFLYAPADYKEGDELECQVCYVGYPLDQLAVLEECGHFLCTTCMAHYFDAQINGGRAKDLKCPEPSCYRMVTLPEVRRVVDRKLFDKYEGFLLEGHLKLDPDCRWCPRPGCGTPMIGHRSIPMMRCPRDGCSFTYCYNCKEAWHQDITCQQYQQWKEENSNAEDRFDKWRQANTKSCPQCRAPIEKNGGCNHMTCASCRHQWCWLCMGAYTRDHYKNEKSACNGKQFT